MKKYLLGLFAVVLAIGLSSFTNKKHRFDTSVYYQLTTFADADVQNNANWTTNSQSCPSGSDRACQIDVPAAQVDGNGVLQNTTITTGTNISGVYYVASATSASSIVNKQ